MRTLLPIRRPPTAFSNERGSAVVVFLALLAIMLVLVAANSKTLVLLKKELRLVEHQQVQRLERSQTNAPAPAARDAKPTSATP